MSNQLSQRDRFPSHHQRMKPLGRLEAACLRFVPIHRAISDHLFILDYFHWGWCNTRANVLPTIMLTDVLELPSMSASPQGVDFRFDTTLYFFQESELK